MVSKKGIVGETREREGRLEKRDRRREGGRGRGVVRVID